MSPAIELRSPKPEDGISVFRLVAKCPPLDPNSIYCNLLQCSHFANTSAAAVCRGELVGFVSGYLIPERDNTLFIWQVAVSEKVRGQGLATNMFQHILNRPDCEHVSYIETTITESNRASWVLYEGLTKKLDTRFSSSVIFDQEKHFDGEHDSEMLVRIGPFK